MGQNGGKKRLTLARQVVASYAAVLILSLVSSFAALLLFYTLHHHFGGHDNVKLDNAGVRTILEYVQSNGDTVLEAAHKAELDKMAEVNGLEYYVRDMEGRLLFTSSNAHIEQAYGSLLLELQTGGSMSIPLQNKASGRIDCVFVLAEYESLWFLIFMLVDLGIPFAFFILYSIMFAGRLSRRMGAPLKELMNAVEKIKDKDLDFSISYRENNEIGDLSAAFEGMRGELKNSLAREWKLEQDRREMTAAITHDLKTPLAIIQGHVEGLQEGIGSDNGKTDEYLGIIAQNVLRARKLIDEMNELVEVDSPDFALRPEEADPVAFLEAKAGEMALLAGNTGIRLKSDISDRRESANPICFDCERLARIIDNLVGNSIRFTPRGGCIALSAVIEDKGLSVRICDTGSGFSGKDIRNMFGKFYKGDAGLGGKGHSGLGLYIAKTIAEKHGGGIKASNLPEGGACVEFHITY
ncbi:MAG TPA: HAMP domain-containing sensor histidine kinase [Clostridia bacterium]|nr:HAMP domain-containing sensor histidine kinase [Clostridia bacterium]